MINRAASIRPLDVVGILVVGVGLAVGVSAGHGIVLAGSLVIVALLILSFLSTSFSLYLLIFSMLLGPEIFFGQGLTGTESAMGAPTIRRGLTLRFDDFLLVVIGMAWLARAAIYKTETLLPKTPLNLPILLYVSASVISTLLGTIMGRVNPEEGFFFNLKYIEYFFLYFMVVSAVDGGVQVRRLVIASLVTCFLVSLFSIAQIPGGERATAPFEGNAGEPNTLGGYLMFMLAIVAGLLLTDGAVPRKWPLVVLLIAGVVALMATLSRASFLSAGVVVIVILGFIGYRRPVQFALLACVVLSTTLWFPDPVKERVMYTFTQQAHQGQLHVRGVTLDTSTSARIRSWEESVDAFKESPLYGKGVTGGKFMDAMYPRLLTETGVLGLGAFLFLCVSIFRVAITCYRTHRDPAVRGLVLGFSLGLLGLLVHAIGSNTFVIVRIMEPFWLYAALVVKLSELSDQPEAEANPATFVSNPSISSQSG